MKQTQEAQVSAVKTTEVKQTKHFPFVVVKTEDDKWHLAAGNSFVSEKTFPSYEEACRYLNSKPWDVIVNFICQTISLVESHETK